MLRVTDIKAEEDKNFGWQAKLFFAVKENTAAVKDLSTHIHASKNSIPVKVVGWMFFILVLSIAGIQGAEWLFKVYLKPPF